jgi:methylenetetrahydrofolate reductase (NADPH)
MKVTEHIKKAKGKALFSFEILPPLKGQNIEGIYSTIDPLMEFKPPFVDVTYHREEYVYKTHKNGLLEKTVTRKRPGTVGICAAIMHKYKIDAVPHIICGGFTKQDTEDALIDLDFLGIDNVLVLRGDPIKSEKRFTPEPNGHAYAIDLMGQVKNLNEGIYLDEDLKYNSPTDFCIGVAGYPEKHFEAPNMKNDLYWLKKKVENGAEYIVTQMFFDNSKFFEFERQCREAGINVPIIPGLKPLSTERQLSLLPQIFHLDLPDDLVDEVNKAKSKDAVREIGVEWCIEQSKELIKNGSPVLHYYSMGKSKNIQKIARAVF